MRYSGEYYDYESGMTYLRARYYDPQLRRFISEDPIKDGLNWYAYCGNNPVMFVDPWGLEYNEVSEFIDNYGATRLYDNSDERYTMVELNGFQQKIYWDSTNNKNAYAIDTYNYDGTLYMERQDFLCLFGVTYEVVKSEYVVDKGRELATNAINTFILYKAALMLPTDMIMSATKIASVSEFLGADLNYFISAGFYVEDWFNVELNGETYYTHIQSSKGEGIDYYDYYSYRTWKASNDSKHLRPTMQGWKTEKIASGYYDAKR